MTSQARTQTALSDLIYVRERLNPEQNAFMYSTDISCPGGNRHFNGKYNKIQDLYIVVFIHWRTLL